MIAGEIFSDRNAREISGRELSAHRVATAEHHGGRFVGRRLISVMTGLRGDCPFGTTKSDFLGNGFAVHVRRVIASSKRLGFLNVRRPGDFSLASGIRERDHDNRFFEPVPNSRGSLRRVVQDCEGEQCGPTFATIFLCRSSRLFLPPC